MKIGVLGGGGRMGRAVIGEVLATSDCALAGATEPAGHPTLGQDLGVLVGAEPAGVAMSADDDALIAAAEVVIEFSTPEATAAHVALAAAHGTAHVIGTTGLSAGQEQTIRDAARRTAIMRAANMSLGVNLLLGLTEQVARALGPDAFDIEIFEMHHRHKVDAPSGTALALGEAAARGRGVRLSEVAARGRDGLTGARRDGAIGFAALRGGDVVGDHVVTFAGAGERLELAHRATDRRIYARGAVTAARWLHGRPPGLYGMADVLGLAGARPMSREVTVYYALQSPWSYLGWARLRQLVAHSGAIAHYRPIQTGPLFQASGTLPLAQRPRQRQEYRLMELRRWRDHLDIPLTLHPRYFPVDETLAAGMVIAHRRRGGDIAALSEAMMRAVWAEERDLAERDTLLAIARELGADGPALQEAAQDHAVRREHEANTAAAIERGVFGVPTFVIGDELFWGQDRLDFVARALG